MNKNLVFTKAIFPFIPLNTTRPTPNKVDFEFVPSSQSRLECISSFWFFFYFISFRSYVCMCTVQCSRHTYDYGTCFAHLFYRLWLSMHYEWKSIDFMFVKSYSICLLPSTERSALLSTHKKDENRRSWSYSNDFIVSKLQLASVRFNHACQPHLR